MINRFYFFAQGSLFLSGIKSSASSTSFAKETGKGWSGVVSVSPGISFAINKILHLESGLGNLLAASYGKINYQKEGGQKRLSENGSVGISSEAMAGLYIGVRFFLPG